MACSPQDQKMIDALISACQPMSPARQKMLIDRVDPTRCRKNQVVQVAIDAIPAVDAQGRIAHLRGIYLAAKARFTFSGGANVAQSKHSMLSLWQALFMTDVTGHDYTSGVDVRTWVDDTYFRTNLLAQWPPLHYGTQGPYVPTLIDTGIANGMGDGSHDFDVSVYLPLASPRMDHSPLEGMIPVPMLTAATAGALKFRVGPNMLYLPGVNADNITFDKLIRPDGDDGMDIYADVVYLPALIADPTWTLYSDTYANNNGKLLHSNERTIYAWVRYLEEDDFQSTNGKTGLRLAENYNGITVMLAATGTVLLGGVTGGLQGTFNDWYMKMMIDVAMDQYGSLNRQQPALELPLTNIDGTQQYAAPLIQSRGQETAVQGEISYKFTKRDCTQTRVQHRTNNCHTVQRIEAMKDAAGITGVKETYYVDGQGRATNNPKPGMPMVIVPTRLPNPTAVKQA